MMKRVFLASALSFSSGALMVPQAHAEVALTAPQQTIVHHIEDTLSQTESFQARFEQVSSADGQTSHGTVLVARPGRMRFTYDAPSPLSVVANEGRMVFQDTSIDQVTTMPLDRTPLGLLLRPHPHFSGDVTITGYHQQKGQIELHVVRTESPSEGELTLFFTAHPLALQGWNVVDAQGRQTRIHLSEVQTGVPVDAKEFALPKDDE
ncbi:LolA family protein [Saccharibacter floricola]|uniref:Outer-membrane lipoprotein carrier protein n=1 Tax=Saccharibacter floricola DSM 15669 TaxID=1123227 RepID=A0ABQ0NWA9_9PROT|nr:outer membrane lipoprotein carrier protein LolA [Saccharibacter floricola]GBQ04773.1 outer-membrane lipoprotein carrier protein [Saccharibacter floricola DSM 15669]